MKTKLLVFTMFWIGLISFSQNTHVPDDNFEQALINLGYDSGSLDDYVPTVNISNVTDLNVGFHFINDLTGIEDFTALLRLDCSSNNLSSLDVSNNLVLTELSCWSNPLGSLDVSNNTQLTFLDCNFSQLTSLDVTQNNLLTTLNCGSNQLTSLDVTQNNLLTTLNCDYNNLTNLDVSNNLALTSLHCVYNTINSLDVGNNTSLTEVYCSWNNLSNLIVGNNQVLTHLYCDNNNLSSLDLNNNVSLTNLLCRSNNLSSLILSKNTSLTYLICGNNNLNNLDVKNGNNTNFTQFQAQSNPNLTCINVDNETYCTTNWTNIDTQTSFSEDCATFLGVDDEILSEGLKLYPNPVSDILSVDSKIALKKIEIYSILGQKVKEINSDFNSISTNHLSRGIFLIKIYSEKGIAVKKLIKQ